MDRMLYISMSGAKEVMLSQANNANNLANANTDGFKQDFNQFRAQHMQGPGWNSRTYALDERPATDFSPGAIKATGRDLDIATKENGFIAILAPDGTEALVRSASMHLTPLGELVDLKGNAILNQGGRRLRCHQQNLSKLVMMEPCHLFPQIRQIICRWYWIKFVWLNRILKIYGKGWMVLFETRAGKL